MLVKFVYDIHVMMIRSFFHGLTIAAQGGGGPEKERDIGGGSILARVGAMGAKSDTEVSRANPVLL